MTAPLLHQPCMDCGCTIPPTADEQSCDSCGAAPLCDWCAMEHIECTRAPDEADDDSDSDDDGDGDDA